jgi:uncharacterized membrane protein YphA (DoxX/SURF4 family)
MREPSRCPTCITTSVRTASSLCADLIFGRDIADRTCAFVLGGYCGVTALLWKQFWKPGDFWISATGEGRTLFWDFFKNFALGAGFLLITFGTGAASVAYFFARSEPRARY